ncbi:hypothetical protein [Rhizobium halophilum]|nr:hypothetical protein [Rhizobium halophilum]
MSWIAAYALLGMPFVAVALGLGVYYFTVTQIEHYREEHRQEPH